jgi:hypothetical protein
MIEAQKSYLIKTPVVKPAETTIRIIGKFAKPPFFPSNNCG